jgi:PatG C-terminal
MADNTGSLDKHRALNYLAGHPREIYYHVGDMHNQNYGLKAIEEVKTSRLSVFDKIVHVIFSYTTHDICVLEKSFICVIRATISIYTYTL